MFTLSSHSFRSLILILVLITGSLSIHAATDDGSSIDLTTLDADSKTALIINSADGSPLMTDGQNQDIATQNDDGSFTNPNTDNNYDLNGSLITAQDASQIAPATTDDGSYISFVVCNSDGSPLMTDGQSQDVATQNDTNGFTNPQTGNNYDLTGKLIIPTITAEIPQEEDPSAAAQDMPAPDIIDMGNNNFLDDNGNPCNPDGSPLTLPDNVVVNTQDSDGTLLDTEDGSVYHQNGEPVLEAGIIRNNDTTNETYIDTTNIDSNGNCTVYNPDGTPLLTDGVNPDTITTNYNDDGTINGYTNQETGLDYDANGLLIEENA